MCVLFSITVVIYHDLVAENRIYSLTSSLIGQKSRWIPLGLCLCSQKADIKASAVLRSFLKALEKNCFQAYLGCCHSPGACIYKSEIFIPLVAVRWGQAQFLDIAPWSLHVALSNF
jgi:hypothetical protein